MDKDIVSNKDDVISLSSQGSGPIEGSVKSRRNRRVALLTKETDDSSSTDTQSINSSIKSINSSTKSLEKLPSLTNSYVKELRRQTIANKNLQSSNDFVGVINSLDELINSKALTDVLECGHVPLLKLNPNERRGISSRGYLNENSSRNRGSDIEFLPSIDSSSIMGASSILKSLNSLPRTYKKPKSNISKKSKDDKKTEILNTALEYKKNAKEILDKSRLYFEAAILFDELNMSEHAIENFENATHRMNAALIVDTYDLPDSPQLQRKLERMSIDHKILFLKRRAEIREQLIFAEEERQRLRAIVSNCQLFRLYLKHSEFKLAYERMNFSFKDCTSTVEHSEMLWYFHNILKDFIHSGIIEIPYFDQVEHSTGGPLAEAHIHILNELVEQDGTNPDFFDCLGLRYAQRGEFEQSRLYYKRARELRDPQCDPEEMIERWKMRPLRISEEKVSEAISKKYYLKYENDIEIDNDIAINRQDYINFNGTHKSSSIKLYIPPDQGWEASVTSLLVKYADATKFLNTLVNSNNPNYNNLKEEDKIKKSNEDKYDYKIKNINTGVITNYKDII